MVKASTAKLRPLAGVTFAGMLIASITLTSPTRAAAGDDATAVVFNVFLFADQIRNIVVSCPEGTRLVGGGVGNSAPERNPLLVLTSGPLDETGTFDGIADGDVARAWSATVRNRSNEGTVLDVIAMCSATTDATIEETTFRPIVEGSAQATCPVGRRVVGGGVVTDADPSVLIETRESGPADETGLTAPTEDGDVALNWFASVHNTVFQANFKTIALCSQASDAVIEAASFELAPGFYGGALATCPAGRRALGGGVGVTGAGETSVAASVPTDGTTTDVTSDNVARGWYAAAFNFGGPNPQTFAFKTMALCVEDTAGGGGALPTPIAPDTQILSEPIEKTRDRTPTFVFTSTAAGATFECAIDASPFAACMSPFTTAKLSRNDEHLFAVRAAAGGVSDPSPASDAFTVKRRHR